jgi:hypothetical protein
MTLGQALDAKVRLIVWRKICQHQAEPDIAAQVVRYGADASVLDWARRARCSAHRERAVDSSAARCAGAPETSWRLAPPGISAALTRLDWEAPLTEAIPESGLACCCSSKVRSILFGTGCDGRGRCTSSSAALRPQPRQARAARAWLPPMINVLLASPG